MADLRNADSNTIESVRKRALIDKPMTMSSKKNTVAIIGGGLAGLSAAYELLRAGHNVTILEASDRVGGRVYTLRKPFSDGLYAEVGALAFSDVHDLVLTYCQLFGLTLDSVGPDMPRYFVRNRYIQPGSELDRLSLQLSEGERRSGLNSPCSEYIDSLLKETGDPLSSAWPTSTALRFDRSTLRTLMGTRGASPDAIMLMRLSYRWNRGFDFGSALGQLAEWGHTYSRSREWFVIAGGNDLLPRAFADKLVGCIHFGALVTAIEQDSEGVRVRVRHADGESTIEAERAVCALPASVLSDVRFSPTLSYRKRRVVEQLRYESVVRLYMQCSPRFWRDGNLNGWLFTDLPVMNVCDCTLNQRGNCGILSAYISGPDAKSVIEMTEAQRSEFCIRHFEQIYPGMRSSVQRQISYCWDENLFARGAYAWLQPGQVGSLLPGAFEAEGRIHFAGAHTSRWFEWQQGALESGHRVAKEIQRLASTNEGSS